MAFGETIEADEAARFQGYADELGAIQEGHARGGPLERVLHVKQHVGAVGELVVSAPESARFGVFAEAGKRFPVTVRFSNGSGRRQPDGTPDARGFAVKLVGVPGKKLINGLEDEVTQDFLLIDTPALPFKDPDEFMKFVRAAKDGPGKLLPRAIASFGLLRALGIVWGAVTAKKVTSFATQSFYSAAPIAFGPSAAKLGLIPGPNPAKAPSTRGPDALRDDLVERLREGDLRWSLRAQLFVDETTSPIEDAFVEWKGPWVELATLTLPKQDPESPRGREVSELVSRMSFDPWHATEEHRPLGSIMRARRVAYARSVISRKAAPEPKSVPAL